MNKHTTFRLTFSLLLLLSIAAGAAWASGTPQCAANTDFETLGADAYRAADYAAAVVHYTCAVDHARATGVSAPKLSALYTLLGNAYRELDNFKAAETQYTESIRFNDDYAIAFNNRGWVRFQMGDDWGALSDFNRALELNPQMDFAFNNRGLVQQRMGYLDAARADFLRAIALDGAARAWAEDNLANVDLLLGS